MDVLSASIKSVKAGGTTNGRKRLGAAQGGETPAPKKRAPAKKSAPARKPAAKSPTSITAKSATKPGAKTRRKAS